MLQTFKMPKSCIIIGGGISGCVAALVLSQLGIKCSIYELRDAPATIGGAVNLTPNALRLLKSLDVKVSGCTVDAIEIFSYGTGAKIAELTFRGPSGPSLRAERSQLLKGLLSAVEKAKVQVTYGSKLVSVQDPGGSEPVTVGFENGSSAQGDFVVGCDGMYSAVRLRYVEPEQIPIYTGQATAYTIVDVSDMESPLHFQQTSMNSGQFGALLASYTDPERKRVYLGSVMETAEQASKEGWKARGADYEATAREIKRRYGGCAIPCIPQLLEKVEDYIFYPVYRLAPEGIWSRGKVILLGDAAHGVSSTIMINNLKLTRVQMPPQGESTGLAIEDSVLFGRVAEKLAEKPIEDVFKAYEKTRKPRINTAYKEAVMRFGRTKDKSWLVQKLEEWFTLAYLWWNADAFEKNSAYDIREEVIVE